MKKQLLLTITIGYATFIPISLHTCSGSSAMVQYEAPQYLNDPIKNACDSYISTSAWNGALCGSALGAVASAAWLYRHPDTQTPWTIAGTAISAGTLIGGVLSYLRASSIVKSNEGKLYSLRSTHGDLLHNSLDTLGFGNQILSRISMTPVPSADLLQQRKQNLENLFANPRYRGHSESDRYDDILKIYAETPGHLGQCLEATTVIFDKIENPKESSYFGFAQENKEDRLFREMKDCLETSKRDAFLSEIISNAEVKKNIELNLSLYQSLSRLRANMKKWLDYIRQTDEYKNKHKQLVMNVYGLN